MAVRGDFMVHKYTRLIPQNIAPNGAKQIGIYNKNGERIRTMPLGRLTPVSKKKLYSFGIVSDTHMGYNKTSGFSSYTNPNDPSTVGMATNDGNGFLPNGTLLRRAFSFMLEQGVDFCCNAGDLTNIGFYWARGDTALFTKQFQEYYDICALFPDMPVYNIMGNHENYNANITENLGEMERYTGSREIAYYFEKGDDVFVMVGQSANTRPMTDTHFEWLQARLAEFRNRRCFVFVHSYIDDNLDGGVSDSGNPCNARDNSIFGMSGTYNRFINLMKPFKNAILFHGHSHMKFESQKFDKDANYTEKNGFKSVHIPSCGDPRTLLNDTGAWETDQNGSQGYIVDVYDDCIVLNGMDFVDKKPVAQGVYKIDTTLRAISPNAS